MKKICDACGKKAEGLGTCATSFKDIILCSNRYEGLKAFEGGRKFPDKETAENRHSKVIAEMREKEYPEKVIQAVDQWFTEKETALDAKSFMEEADSFLMTTCPSIEGYNILSYHGVVSGESVLGTGFASSMNASVSDILGAESDAFISKLHEARSYAKKRLVGNCVKTGGNALIGVDIEYTMFGSNMIGVIMNGTSVTVKKLTDKE